MSITCDSAHVSLAQRIARVRRCLLVEISTGISPDNKDLFMSLCQEHEQKSIAPSGTTDPSSQSTSLHAALLSHPIAKNIPPDNVAAMTDNGNLSRQRRIGFSVIREPSLEGFDDWTDTDT